MFVAAGHWTSLRPAVDSSFPCFVRRDIPILKSREQDIVAQQKKRFGDREVVLRRALERGIWTSGEMAALFCVAPRTISTFCSNGELRHFRIGPDRRSTTQDLWDFAKKNSIYPVTEWLARNWLPAGEAQAVYNRRVIPDPHPLIIQVLDSNSRAAQELLELFTYLEDWKRRYVIDSTDNDANGWRETIGQGTEAGSPMGAGVGGNHTSKSELLSTDDGSSTSSAGGHVHSDNCAHCGQPPGHPTYRG